MTTDIVGEGGGMSQGVGASYGPGSCPTGQAPTGLDAPRFDPSRISDAIAEIEPRQFYPLIRRASDELYEQLLVAVDDHLRDNLDWNLKAHLAMLERENQRMRTELWEVDQAIGGTGVPGHDGRLKAIAALEKGAVQSATMLFAVSRVYGGETRYETALRYIRERDRDSDTQPKAGDSEAAPLGSGAGPKDIAQGSQP